MNNLNVWNKVCRPPTEALKQIKGGRLSGMTDINPQWRLKIMTEVYGQCGVGWYYEIKKFWTEQGAAGEVMCFVHLELFTLVSLDMLNPDSIKAEWSKPITGIGGSALVAKESSGLRANDEGYKMATTDALSVAMKQLGVGADIYAGLWDGSKYKEAPIVRLPKLTDTEAEAAHEIWMQTKKQLAGQDPSVETEAWLNMPSNVRSAIKEWGAKLAEADKLSNELDGNTKKHLSDMREAVKPKGD